VLAACGTEGGSTASAPVAASAPSVDQTVPVKIGYFPNLTHAPGLVADAEGFFEKRIGAGKASVTAFNAGPEVIQALFSTSVDIAYIGPSPTVTAYVKSRGQAVRVIAGSTSGGAALVVKPGITDATGLKGKSLATPQLGNTQDVALRYWLKQQGVATTAEGGGEVTIVPQKNSAAVNAFAQGQIDGAWVPEPFVSLLVARGGKVLVDERALWPDQKFVTTNVIVRNTFADEHPDTVRAFLEAHLDALQFIEDEPQKAQADVIAKIKALTDQDTDPGAVAQAWKSLTFTADPLAATLKRSAEHADAVGLLEDKSEDGFAGLWDLAQVNAALKARGRPPVTS
jgi:NitT/TauT family transport system substrate-binding protein